MKSCPWKTRKILVGEVGVGGDNPIRIQSMTTSNTRDVDATIDQIMKLSDFGCEIARITVQGRKEADACEGIKNGLLKKGYTIPLVADIHFYPPAAMRVVEFVDKVRVNPGNFVDKRAIFKTIEYDDVTYQEEIDRIEEKFSPLVEKCIRLGRAMRIGTNHGSLSDRIMSRYGDTAFGMVESALEFARVCRKLDYHDFMFSMKASNPLVMIQAYRLLTAEMMKIGWDYPLHLGVTEAGSGEDGRIKSAMGIGSLLLDGLGDTIRVSLTEDPWFEIDPCKRLVRLAELYQHRGIDPFDETLRSVGEIKKRAVRIEETLPLHRDGSVILPITKEDAIEDNFFIQLGCKMQLNLPMKQIDTVDAIYLEEGEIDSRKFTQAKIGILSPDERWPVVSLDEDFEAVIEKNPPCIFLKLTGDKIHQGRLFFQKLQEHGCTSPVILKAEYSEQDKEDVIIHVAAELGALLADGLGEGVCLKSSKLSLSEIRLLSFNLLQAARMRHSKTEFIACPGCGRTLFDLQQVTERIKAKTAHLPGVKIAIMGCIVNGPGEMVDADFGYVGSRAGKVDLYVGKTCVQQGIDFADADAKLIELIKTHGRWKEPSIAK